MTISNIGLAMGSSAKAISKPVKIGTASTYSSAVVVFSTDYPKEGKASFDCSANWATAPKGGGTTANQGLGSWKYTDGNWVWNRFTMSALSDPTKKGSKYIWNIPLSGLNLKWNGSEHVSETNAFLGMFGASTTSFDARVYDAIYYCIHIKCNWEDGTSSSVASAEGFIYYVPDYQLTSFKLTASGNLAIGYTVTDSWTRTDDRFALQWLYNAATDDDLIPYRYAIDKVVVDSSVIWVTSDGDGYLNIPFSKLLRDPEDTEVLYVGIRVACDLAPIGTYWGKLIGVSQAASYAECETPTGTVRIGSTDMANIYVTATGTGDKSATMDRYTAKIVGSTWACDSVTVEAGQTAVLPFPPLGKTSYVQVVAECDVSDDEVAVSSAVIVGSVTVPALGDDGVPRALIQDAEAPTTRAVARYNLSRSWSGERTQDVVQLNGRSRPSAYFGSGIDVTHSFDFAVGPNEVRRGATITTEEDFYKLLTAGVCIVRLGDGRRFAVALNSTGASVEADSEILTLRTDGQEVDYG